MHIRPLTEAEVAAGEFSAPAATDTRCRKCGGSTVTVRIWDSSCGAYTDYRYECSACGHHWWIEGPDA